MLELALATSDGGTAWRHALAAGEARAGWECVGPLGLTKRLGRLYGLRGEPVPRPERVSVYASRLAQVDDGARSFSESRRRDPWGVASYLLGLRDRLRSAGWDGRALDGSPRLRDLALVERHQAPGLLPVPPGLADLLATLLVEIERSPELPEPFTLRLLAEEASFDPVVRAVLGRLAARGATVVPAGDEAPGAPPSTDLGRLQRALLSSVKEPGPALAGDGSVLVLEADTPLEAGELVAAYARARPLDAVTVVAGHDLAALEVAFARHGLPALARGEPSRWRPALQILPLRLALAFAPRDPFRAAELLLLPVSPIPAGARRRLLDALVEQPGVGGPAWRRAVETALGDAGERARREAAAEGAAAAESAAAQAVTALRERLEAWFGGEAHDPAAGLPASAAVGICEQVARWAENRARAAEAPDAVLQAAAGVARTLARMIATQPPGTRLSPVALEQLHDVAAGDGVAAGDRDGEAGRPAIALGPGAVLPGASEVLWWGFLDDGGGGGPDPWTSAEREQLAASGVDVPARGERRSAEARGWRRAVLAASERLVLVRWSLDGAGAAPAHPLGDEIAARLDRALAPCVVTSAAALAGVARHVAPARSDRAPAPEITPRALLRVPPETIALDQLSPSSLEKLLGCPASWVLEYAAGLRRRGMARIPSGSRLLGTFAHAIIEDVLLGPSAVDLQASAPDDAALAAGRAFDARVESEAAPLVARGAEVARHRARAVVVDATRALFALLHQGGWRPRAAEQELAGTLDGTALNGSADLVIEKDGRPAILDLKLANPAYFRKKLEEGEALQLALYAAMARRGRELPPTGYFVIDRGELLTLDGGAFPGGRQISGPPLEETLHAAEEALRFWREALGRGAVASKHEDLSEQALLDAGEIAGRPAPGDGPGAIAPPCRFCEFTTLCGIALCEVTR